MPTSDGLTEQTAEVQDALRQVLQESGAAGTGPLTLPPPADITSTQQRSEARTDDPDSYSNTLNVDLYRDADGKVWTQPGPGHEEADIKMRVRKWHGQWHVATERRRMTRRRKRGAHLLIESETDAMATSGAPVTELGSVERFEQFSPQSAKEAIRQTMAKLQTKGAVYVYDPNAPVPQHTAGLLPNGLLAAAALAGLGALAAFAGIGPFAAAATPVAATTAPATIAPSVATPTPFVKLNGSGTIGFALPARYGSGVNITGYNCQNTFLTPVTPPGTSPGPEQPAMGIDGLLNGHSFRALFSATNTLVIFENVSFTPAMSGGPASTYVQGQHVAGTVAIQTGPDVGTSFQSSGTVTIDLTCTGGGAPAGVVQASTAVSVAPVSSAVAAAPAQSGPSPWGPGLAVLAVASAASALAMKTRAGSAAPRGVTVAPADRSTTAKAPPDCSALERELQRLQGQFAYDRGWLEHDTQGQGLGEDGANDTRWNEAVSERRRMVADDRINIARVEEALARCRAGASADVVPALREDRGGLDQGALGALGEEIRDTMSADEKRASEQPSGFDPTPPPPPTPDDDEPKRRPEIG